MEGPPEGVYSPADVMVPVAAAPPLTPLTCQETAVFAVWPTVAVNCTVVPTRVWVAVPVTATVTGTTTGTVAAGMLDWLLHPARAAIPTPANNARNRQQGPRTASMNVPPQGIQRQQTRRCTSLNGQYVAILEPLQLHMCEKLLTV